MNAPPIQVPPPPVQQSPQPSFSFNRAFNERPKRHEPDGILDFIIGFLDPTFSSYVTPWIVKITWIAVLVGGSLLSFSYVYFMNNVGDTPSFPKVNGGVSPEALEQLLISQNLGPKQMAHRMYMSKLWGFGGGALLIVLLVFGLLWTRVLLESVIVVFDVSTTLKRIERGR